MVVLVGFHDRVQQAGGMVDLQHVVRLRSVPDSARGAAIGSESSEPATPRLSTYSVRCRVSARRRREREAQIIGASQAVIRQ